MSGGREAVDVGVPQTFLSGAQTGVAGGDAEPAGGHDGAAVAQSSEEGQPAAVGGLHCEAARRRRPHDRGHPAVSG